MSDKRLRLEKSTSIQTAELSRKHLEEGILKLSEAITADEIYDIIKDTVRSILDNVTELEVFARNRNNEFVTQGCLNQFLPDTGVCRKVIVGGQRKQYKSIDPNDPLLKLLTSSTSNFTDCQKMYLSPIHDRHSKGIVVFLVIVCNEMSTEAREHLDYFEKLISAAYYRLTQLEQLPIHQEATTKLDEESHHILKLCGELYDRDGERLQQKLLHFLQDQLQCELCLLFFVAEDGLMFSNFTDSAGCLQEIIIPVSQHGLGSITLRSQDTLVFEDLTELEKSKISETCGIEIQSMMGVPVESRSDQDIIALFCAFNKTDSRRFTGTDKSKIKHTFRYTSAVLTSTLAYQKERRLKMQTEILLQVAKNLFSKLEDMTELLKSVMKEARSLTNAERCSLFLVEYTSEKPMLVAKVFDSGNEGSSTSREIRIPIDKGIAGHVASTGEILVIKDAYQHELFYRGVDSETGFRTKAILCFPIKNDDNEVIGVAELCNKSSGEFFTSEDVEVAKAFSIYCAIAIAHSLMYSKVQEAQKRVMVTNELMLYHLQNVKQEDVRRVTNHPPMLPTSFKPGIDQFNYSVRCIPDADSLQTVQTIFEEFGLFQRWHLNRETVVRFCLTVKQGYRTVPYHNWTHAFSVTHFAYLCNNKCKLKQYLTDAEIFSLIVSCMCHDIDHRGTNNAFQISSRSTLGSLYSSQGSVMERHHFAQTVAILNSQGCNIFSHVSSDTYKEMVDLIQYNILSTDLAHHFRLLNKFKELSEIGYNRENPHHRKLLLSLIMTSSDLSDQSKSWDNVIFIAEQLYKEFFIQGDLERDMGNRPNEMMDRDRANIPDQQLEFLRNVATPVFQLLSIFLPETRPVYQSILANCRRWEIIKTQTNGRNILVNDKLDIQDIDVSAVDKEMIAP